MSVRYFQFAIRYTLLDCRLVSSGPYACFLLSGVSPRQNSRKAVEYHVIFRFSSEVRRNCRSRKLALRRIDCIVNFLRGAESSLERRGKIARAERSQRLAQANSIARIANPAGITMNAGPGNTINAIPKASTVLPTTATAIRLMGRKVAFVPVTRLSPNGGKESCSPTASCSGGPSSRESGCPTRRSRWAGAV
jgi:hypothetical protein